MNKITALCTDVSRHDTLYSFTQKTERPVTLRDKTLLDRRQGK